jgi:hypothetical protein
MIPLLAAADDSPIKVVVGAIFIFIWIISGLMSAAAKKREEERRKRAFESIPVDGPIAPQSSLPPQLPFPTPVQMQPPVQQFPPMLRRIDSPLRQQLRRALKPPKLRRTSAASPPIQLPKPATLPPIQAANPAPIPTPLQIPTSASASTLRSWLRPATLRQQFILTEVFQPPISLR